nr:hypothetical protein CFP56_36319 [Quercus suber]
MRGKQSLQGLRSVRCTMNATKCNIIPTLCAGPDINRLLHNCWRSSTTSSIACLRERTDALLFRYCSFRQLNHHEGILLTNTLLDASCTQNGGIGVDITNDGCLNEAGRGSVYIPNNGDAAFTYCLVITSNDGTCSCQNVGYNFTPTGFCKTLNPSDQSYRFIQEACGQNNC